MESLDRSRLSELTADIVAAYVGNNATPVDELISIIGAVYTALASAPSRAIAPEAPRPAVDPRQSVSSDFIVCLEDGKRFKSLKRHLARYHDTTPAEYRQRWGLPRDYPMVATSYSNMRSQLAKSFGLGVKVKAGVTPGRSPSSAGERVGNKPRRTR